MQTNQPIETYSDFWPYYLREHSKPQTRAVHYVGTAVALASLTALIITGNDWFGLGALIGGYGFAWIGHFLIEKNRPATLTYPLLVTILRLPDGMGPGDRPTGSRARPRGPRKTPLTPN